MDLTPEPDLNILFVEFVLARQMNRDFSKKKKRKKVGKIEKSSKIFKKRIWKELPRCSFAISTV